MENGGVKNGKQALRTRMRAMCKALDAAQRESFSRLACEQLMGLAAFAKAACILGYRAMPHECDPAHALAWARAQGACVAYPRCVGERDLELYVPEDENAFLRGRYGIWEPDPARCARVEAAELECIVVPGLAFDAACMRLGQGAGYYDTLLAKGRVFAAAIAFPFQVVEAVPTEAHDRPADAVAAASAGLFLHGYP